MDWKCYCGSYDGHVTESVWFPTLAKVNTLSPLFKQHEGQVLIHVKQSKKNATLEQCSSGEFISWILETNESHSHQF